MNYLGDILLDRDVPDEQIAQAIAAAFGVSRVTVWPMARVMDHDAGILVQRDRQDGDFPYLLRLTATPASGLPELPEMQFINAVRSIAQALGQDVLTDSGVQYQDNLLVVTPRGDTLEVALDDEARDSDRLELTPESRRRLHTLTLATATSSSHP